MPNVEIPVLECSFDRDTRRGVKGKHFIEEVESVRVCLRKETLEGYFVGEGEVANVFLGARGTDAGEGLFIGGAEIVEDLVELVDIVTAFEERAAAEEFSEDTTNGPDVD